MTTNNNKAHGPVSLDRLHQIREILSKAAAQSDGGNLGYAMADAVKVIDGAIAAFGAEPAPVDIEMLATVLRNAPLAPSDSQGKPRAPVVPDEDPRDAFERTFKMPKHVTRCGTGYAVTAYSAWLAHDFVRMWEGWNACRAAMLQVTEPVSKPYKLPPNSFTDEDLEGMIHGNNPQSNAYRELLAFRRKSTVAPDCWIPCSERIPEESTDADGGATCYLVLYADGKEPNGGSSVGVWNVTYLRRWWAGFITHWQPLPAAPQQEVKP